MAEPPKRRTSRDPREAAEAAFRSLNAPPKPVEAPRATVPGGKEQVTLRIDRAILDFFQAEGPGWQDRMIEALRAAARTTQSIPVDKLNASNDE